MQTQRATALGHVDHPVDELGDLVDQGGELVNHDDEAGRGIGVAAVFQLQQVFGPLLLQQPLPMVQLGVQGHQHPAHQMGVQIGDQAHRVGQLHAITEGGAALVVHEQERHPGRAVGNGQGRHPALQELALARTGGAPHQRMGTLGPQIEGHLLGGPQADDGPDAPIEAAVGLAA